MYYPVETGDVHGPELGRHYLVFDEAVLRAGGSHDFRFDAAGIPAVIPIYKLRGQWPSAMAQGRGLSVLARAWQKTAEACYLDGARRALHALRCRPPRTASRTPGTDSPPTRSSPAQPAPHVLNGMIFGLFGLWDLVRARPDDTRARALFERSAASVAALLPLYDAGAWSLYDL